LASTSWECLARQYAFPSRHVESHISVMALHSQRQVQISAEVEAIKAMVHDNDMLEDDLMTEARGGSNKEPKLEEDVSQMTMRCIEVRYKNQGPRFYSQ
jgi:hypothetical protein